MRVLHGRGEPVLASQLVAALVEKRSLPELAQLITRMTLEDARTVFPLVKRLPSFPWAKFVRYCPALLVEQLAADLAAAKATPRAWLTVWTQLDKHVASCSRKFCFLSTSGQADQLMALWQQYYPGRLPNVMQRNLRFVLRHYKHILLQVVSQDPACKLNWCRPALLKLLTIDEALVLATKLSGRFNHTVVFQAYPKDTERLVRELGADTYTENVFIAAVLNVCSSLAATKDPKPDSLESRLAVCLARYVTEPTEYQRLLARVLQISNHLELILPKACAPADFPALVDRILVCGLKQQQQEEEEEKK